MADGMEEKGAVAGQWVVALDRSVSIPGVFTPWVAFSRCNWVETPPCLRKRDKEKPGAAIRGTFPWILQETNTAEREGTIVLSPPSLLLAQLTSAHSSVAQVT